MTVIDFPADEIDEPLVDNSALHEAYGVIQPLNTDAANADLFVARNGDSFRYVTEWQSWIAWDGRRWTIAGAEDMAFSAAVRSARQSFSESCKTIFELQKEQRAVLLERGGKCDASDKLDARIEWEQKARGWYLGSQNTAKANACTTQARTRLLTSMSELDRDPWLFNVANGTIDLRTGELKPHDRNDHITQLSDIEWDDHARCPTWDAFIDAAMLHDIDLVLYLQRVIGYCMTGSIEEHALFFLHGTGGNGKSTFTKTMGAMMGDYSCAAPRNLLFEQKSGIQPHPTELARLHQRRFVTCSEIGERAVMDEAKVKDITGGDVIPVRRMQEDFWDLHPVHKLLICGNHKPIIRGDDDGIWRRMRLVLWLLPVTVPDKKLSQKLRAELPGILRWAVNGALEWQRIGLAEPKRVTEATLAYRRESDAIGEFLKACEVGPNAVSSMVDLRTHYEEWCKGCGQDMLSPFAFGKKLRSKGFDTGSVRVVGDVVKGWKGIGIPRRQ